MADEDDTDEEQDEEQEDGGENETGGDNEDDDEVDDSDFDPNGVAGVPYDSRGFVPPIRIKIPAETRWKANTVVKVSP